MKTKSTQEKILNKKNTISPKNNGGQTLMYRDILNKINKT